jgi:hypothetical protein
MSRRLTVLVVAFLVLSLSPGSQATAAEVDALRLQDELDFRRDFGLNADETYVRQLMANPQAYSHWPVALTRDEIAEMDRRFAMEEQMTPLEDLAERLPNFAGHWIDQPRGGIITVAFTSGADDHRQALLSLVPPGAQLELINVRFSLAELNAVYERIAKASDELRSQGIQIAHLGVDVSENRVKVGVVALDAGAESTLRARYGDAIVTVYANPTPTACTGKETCIGPPLRGGISGAPAGTTYRNRCSIAFMVHYSNLWQWLTAGHCAKTTGVVWHQGANAAWPIGTIKATCWPQCNYSDAARAGNLSATYASTKVWLNNLGQMRNIGASQGLNGDDEGDMTCLNARRSEASARCGFIDHIGRIDYPGGVYFLEMRFATYASMYGDSGGAVHSPVRSPNYDYMAYGVQSGCTNLGSDDVCYGFGVYSHIYRVTQELQVTVCTTASPCP